MLVMVMMTVMMCMVIIVMVTMMMLVLMLFIYRVFSGMRLVVVCIHHAMLAQMAHLFSKKALCGRLFGLI
jgi:hypothetical protein